MKYYAVLDTNVLVSALLSKNPNSPTVRIMEAIFNGMITPLYHTDILCEYGVVLRRKKFCFQEKTIELFLDSIKEFGQEVHPQPTGEILPDMDDLIFYEVAMERQGDDAYLVTGNLKHYPLKHFIVSPTQMMGIIDSHSLQ